jgi:hypothetical protein
MMSAKFLESKVLKENALLFLIFAILFFGGFGIYTNYLIIISLLCLILLLLASKFLFSGRPSFPNGFMWYLLFIASLFVSTLYSYDRFTSFYNLVLFVCGGMLWYIFYNLRIHEDKILRFEILLGLLFFTYYIVNFLFGKYYVNSLSLVMPSIVYLSHHHLGDYWAAIIAAIALSVLNKNTKFSNFIWLIVLVLASFIILISYSRSALLSTAFGLFFLFKDRMMKGKIIKFALAIIVIFCAVIFFSFSKTIIFSRPYFLEGLVGVLSYPFGSGIGNFMPISEAGKMTLELNAISKYAHNLFIEMLAATGILSIPFFVFVYKAGKSLLEKEKGLSFLVTISIFANFMTDYTYFIPTMLFIFFINLGLAQKNFKTT